MLIARNSFSVHGILTQLLIAQGTGIAFATGSALVVGTPGIFAATVPAPFLLVAVQALVAALTARLLGATILWVVFHILFGPALFGALTLMFHPNFYGAIFLAMLAIFGSGTFAHRVPLFLSSTRALAHLDRWLPQGCFSMLDLGAGTGKVLRFVANRRPDARVSGVEVAPLPFMLAWLRGFAFGYRVEFRDFWRCDLSEHDVVYAYLSPAPMQRLWAKARKEMRPGSLFISNSFAVPGVTPTYVARYGRNRGAVLHIWRMP